MSKNKTTERKSTVTVTIGPKTELLLEVWKAKMDKAMPGMPWTWTDAVSALTGWALEESAINEKRKLPEGWRCIHD